MFVDCLTKLLCCVFEREGGGEGGEGGEEGQVHKSSAGTSYSLGR